MCACADEIILCALKRRSCHHFNQACPSEKKNASESDLTKAILRLQPHGMKDGLKNKAAPWTAAMQIKCHCYEVNFNLIQLPPGFGAHRFVSPSAFKWNSRRSIRLRRSYICYMTHPLFCSPSRITKARSSFFSPPPFFFWVAFISVQRRELIYPPRAIVLTQTVLGSHLSSFMSSISSEAPFEGRQTFALVLEL